jgi:prevent-host-death family protein
MEALLTRQYSIAEAKDQLPSLVHEVEKGVTVELTRRGKPVAVVLSRGDYVRLKQGSADFWQALERFRTQVDLKSLGVDPDEIWGAVRDRSPGRDVRL